MINQTFQHASGNISEDLHQILNDMETCITEQETVIVEERDAMRTFNADALTELVERRARSQSILDELESRCKRMMRLSDQHHTMEHLIDAYAEHNAGTLQGMRVELMRRMQTLEKNHVENHLRLRAAWNVTTSILQQVGAIEIPQTYQNTAYSAQQASR